MAETRTSQLKANRVSIGEAETDPADFLQQLDPVHSAKEQARVSPFCWYNRSQDNYFIGTSTGPIGTFSPTK